MCVVIYKGLVLREGNFFKVGVLVGRIGIGDRMLEFIERKECRDYINSEVEFFSKVAKATCKLDENKKFMTKVPDLGRT